MASLALGYPQELLDDEAAETVADKDERRLAKLRLGQEPHQHARRAVREMHGAAAPARHCRLVADEVDAEPLDLLPERPRPKPFAVGDAAQVSSMIPPSPCTKSTFARTAPVGLTFFAVAPCSTGFNAAQ